MKNEILDFKKFSDERGELVSIEALKNIPFEVKRVYYIFNTKTNLSRGYHAHKNLLQVLICINGYCDIILDDGNKKQTYHLNKPNQGLFVSNMMWREMHNFSEDCILMVLASEHYEEEDYIRDYTDFLKHLKDITNKSSYFTHNKAIVESDKIGDGTTIWAFSHILPGAIIGENCNINDHTFIENDVSLGNNVTVKSGVHIWNGVTIEDNVFIGPSVVFTNDLNPRSKRYPSEFTKTIIRKYASIGANSTIIAGNTIGEYSMIGAGSVVTKNIPPYTLWYGNPAVFKGFVCKCGEKLTKDLKCKTCNENYSDIIKVKGS